MQILLDPNRAALLANLANGLGVRPTGWIRDVIYKELERCVPAEAYEAALQKDKQAWQDSVQRRVEGRMKSKKQTLEA